MCGIAGFIGEGTEATLERMAETLHHRGPDDHGTVLYHKVGLAQTRLSIIDLSPDGHQPMFTADKTVGIVFNGEIYNFRELRAGLLARGYQFHSKTDTEVILHAYREYGTECFQKFNGMFAIALYDFAKGRLVLVRDRMGKKPLYWGIFGTTLMFGSELKALMAHECFVNKLDLSSVNTYLHYDYVPTPRSIFKHVHKLEPATYLTWQRGQLQKQHFWHAEFAPAPISFEDAEHELDRRLDAAVTCRLVADVPIGIFLSGGLDSSTIAYYAQKNSALPIDTFSIGFTEPSYDESAWARRVASFLGTKHHESILEPGQALALIPKIADLIDEPLADASIIPTHLLAAFARRHVTVALGGDGGDELFAGYPTFQAETLAKLYSIFPEWFRRGVVERLLAQIPPHHRYMSFGFKAKSFIQGYYGPSMYRHQRWLGSFQGSDCEHLFLPHIWRELDGNDAYEDIDRYRKELGGTALESQTLYLYQRMYMMDQVLVKVDRATMAHALEARAPFLDYTVVDFVNRLPYPYKYRNGTTKYILKKLMQHKLPPGVAHRSKKGFGIPLGTWLRHELRSWCNEVLSEVAIRKSGLFCYDYIHKLKEDHFAGRRDNRKLLWNLLVFQQWHRRWLRT